MLQQFHLPIPIHGPFRLLSRFNKRCGEAVWKWDGIVSKLIGDAVLAIFNFPIRLDRYCRTPCFRRSPYKSVLASLDCGKRKRLSEVLANEGKVLRPMR